MVLALAFVLALMGLLAYVLRRLGLADPAGRAHPGVRRRLQVVESLALSPNHRAVLIKRDQAEHLIVIGPGGDTVVEQNIHHTSEGLDHE
jgi:flagellar protein FliO/FliZ